MSFGVAATLASDVQDIKAFCFVSGAYDPYESLQALFRENGEVHFDGMSWRKFASGETIRLKPGFWQGLKKFDAFSNLRSVTMPTFIVHGNADSKISFHEAEQAYTTIGNLNKKMKIVDGGDHGIIDVTSSTREEFLNEVSSWFKSTL